MANDIDTSSKKTAKDNQQKAELFAEQLVETFEPNQVDTRRTK